MSAVFTAVACLSLWYSVSAQWGYDEGELNWTASSPECGGLNQSPIDIVIDVPDDCGQILELEYETDLGYFAIKNTGHSLQLTPFALTYDLSSELSGISSLTHANDTNVRLQNLWYDTYTAPIHQEYCLDSLHFHWGLNDSAGSEHSLNGTFSPLEMHIVHFACDYYKSSVAQEMFMSGDLSEQYDDDNVLAVISVLFAIGEPNPALEQILTDLVIDGVSVFHDAGYALQSHLIPLYFSVFNMSDLVPENRSIVGYAGSLTTPPCLETVRWHVLRETMTVSEEQMERFRSLLESNKTDDSVAPNHRDPQPLNNRTLFVCQDTIDAMAVAKDTEPGEPTLPPTVSENEDADIWFIVALVFIILFGVACIVSFYSSYTNYAFGHTQDKDEKAKFESRTTASKYEPVASEAH